MRCVHYTADKRGFVLDRAQGGGRGETVGVLPHVEWPFSTGFVVVLPLAAHRLLQLL